MVSKWKTFMSSGIVLGPKQVDILGPELRIWAESQVDILISNSIFHDD